MSTTPKTPRPTGRRYPTVNALLRGEIPPKAANATIDCMQDQMAAQNLRLLDHLTRLVNACTPLRLPTDRSFHGICAPDKATLEAARKVAIESGGSVLLAKRTKRS